MTCVPSQAWRCLLPASWLFSMVATEDSHAPSHTASLPRLHAQQQLNSSRSSCENLLASLHMAGYWFRQLVSAQPALLGSCSLRSCVKLPTAHVSGGISLSGSLMAPGCLTPQLMYLEL